MRIKMNKKYIEYGFENQVKEDMKFFAEAYEVGDLIREFNEQTKFYCFNQDVLKVEIEAMTAGWYYGNKTSFCVSIVLDGEIGVEKICFYIDKNLKIDVSNDILVSYKRYVLAKK